MVFRKIPLLALAQGSEVLPITRVLGSRQCPRQAARKIVIEDFAKHNPRAKTAKPEQFVHMSLIRELDQNGLIDGLYRQK